MNFYLGYVDYVFHHIFTESDSEGVIPISMDYRDLAGNIGETIDETSDGSEVTLDMNPPAEFKIEMVGSLQGELIQEQNEDSNDTDKKSKKKKEDLGLIPIIVISVIGLTILVVWISWFKIFSKSG